MDRLLVLRLESSGIEAEAVFNGVPLARVGGVRTVAYLPVHEFTVAGANDLELVVRPAPIGAEPPPDPEPLLCDGHSWASVRLLLPRVGGAAHPSVARTLAQLDWAGAADELVMTPHRVDGRFDLQIAFPRWRWLDAPVVDPAAVKKDLSAYLLDIAVGLARGNPEPLVQASRIRLEDLATAYQRNLADDVGRLRVHIQRLHAAAPLQPTLPTPAKLLLRPVAGGRLLECLSGGGGPLLQSPLPGGGRVGWPLRVAAVEGRFYALR